MSFLGTISVICGKKCYSCLGLLDFVLLVLNVYVHTARCDDLNLVIDETHSKFCCKGSDNTVELQILRTANFNEFVSK